MFKQKKIIWFLATKQNLSKRKTAKKECTFHGGGAVERLNRRGEVERSVTEHRRRSGRRSRQGSRKIRGRIKNPRPKRRRSSRTPLVVLFMGEGEFFLFLILKSASSSFFCFFFLEKIKKREL